MKIEEGEAKLYVPEFSVTRKADVFYNPGMKFERDVTISLLKCLSEKRRLSVCDPLAASGVRGIRLLKEVENVDLVVFNDINKKACELIKKNLKANNIEKGRYEIYNMDANKLFLEHKNRFDFVDIDPFGSPIKYLSTVFYSLKKDAMLACTAMDTAALSGANPEKCKKVYGITACKTTFFKELGIRNLTACINLRGFPAGFSFEPVFYNSMHYFRVVGFAKRSLSLVTSASKKLGAVSYCSRCSEFELALREDCSYCKSSMSHIFTTWLGSIKDDNFLKKAIRHAGSGDECVKILSLINEAEEPFYYDTHYIASYMKRGPKAVSEVIRCLKKRKFTASRSSIFSTGVKTNARLNDIASCFVPPT